MKLDVYNNIMLLCFPSRSNVFVLELTGRPLGGSTAVQVTLDGVGGSVVDRNIVLVLKSAPAVNWVVTTRRLHGTLDIYVGHRAKFACEA